MLVKWLPFMPFWILNSSEKLFLLPLLAEYANNACEYACSGLFCRGHDLGSI